jgi:hypothetical protein
MFYYGILLKIHKNMIFCYQSKFSQLFTREKLKDMLDEKWNVIFHLTNFEPINLSFFHHGFVKFKGISNKNEMPKRILIEVGIRRIRL